MGGSRGGGGGNLLTHHSVELAVLDHGSVQALPVRCQLGRIKHHHVP